MRRRWQVLYPMPDVRVPFDIREPLGPGRNRPTPPKLVSRHWTRPGAERRRERWLDSGHPTVFLRRGDG